MIFNWATNYARPVNVGAGPLIAIYGSAPFTPVSPAIKTERGHIDYDQVRMVARQGTGAQFQMFYGPNPASGNIPVWDAHGNLVDQGIPVAAIAVNFVYDEIPFGAINGTNVTYTLVYAPNPPASLDLYLNGIEQFPGRDFTLSANVITFMVAPISGDWIYADYNH